MIHIVFETANVKALQTAMEMDELLQGEILEIKDDFAVGPIAGIYETEGYQQRRDWWKEVVQFSPYENQLDIVDDKLTVHNLVNTLTQDESQEAWIWMGQNAHDVSGYFWLMSQLASFAGRIQVLYLNNLPFFNEKGSIFYPTHLHEIQPREFLKAKKLARPITLGEFNLDQDEGKKIGGENAMVRFLEGGKKLVGKEVTYFDKSLLLHITKDAQKLNKVIGSALNKMTVQTGDAFVVWRLRVLSNEGVLVINGDLAKGWKEWTVQLASA